MSRVSFLCHVVCSQNKTEKDGLLTSLNSFRPGTNLILTFIISTMDFLPGDEQCNKVVLKL